jgi:hypothetical protein
MISGEHATIRARGVMHDSRNREPAQFVPTSALTMMSRRNDLKALDVPPRGATRSIHLLGVLLAAGCTSPTDPDTSTASSELTVSAYTTSGCSTSVVLGLSKQIADEITCMSPTSLQAFSQTANIVFSSNAVLPYLDPASKTAITKVGAGASLQINSGFRTVAQQYLLYSWYLQKRCGITAAATPGRSNHQSGRAIDLANYSSRISAMSAQGWAHNVPGDAVHFDHLASPDIRGMDVRAFQRLWNRNNPSDKIAEDGAYGPQTEARLKKSPATGFSIGATCASTAERPPGNSVDVASIDGPDRVAAGGHATFSITVDNLSETDWPAATRLVVNGGSSSALYDSSSWRSPTEVGPIGTAIPAGGRGVIDVEVAAPLVAEDTAMQVIFELNVDGAPAGTFPLAMTVTPNGDADISNEAADVHDVPPDVDGGCRATGNTGWLAMILPALVVLRRRRRESPRRARALETQASRLAGQRVDRSEHRVLRRPAEADRGHCGRGVAQVADRPRATSAIAKQQQRPAVGVGLAHERAKRLRRVGGDAHDLLVAHAACIVDLAGAVEIARDRRVVPRVERREHSLGSDPDRACGPVHLGREPLRVDRAQRVIDIDERISARRAVLHASQPYEEVARRIVQMVLRQRACRHEPRHGIGRVVARREQRRHDLIELGWIAAAVEQ